MKIAVLALMEEDPQVTRLLPRVRSMADLPPLLDNRFELFEEVGAGPVGRVFRGWDHQLQRIVAVKVLDPRIATDEEAASAFEKAARSAGELPRHPHIVPILELGRDAGTLYIVWQMVDGRHVGEATAGQDLPSVEKAFRLCGTAARALAFAHEYGHIHGDIKPQNILVSRDDSVLVGDFGMVRVAEIWRAKHPELPAPENRYLPKTDSFLAPEPVAADIYALGAVLFELVTGALPGAQAFTGERPDPRERVPDLPPAAATVVSRALYTDGRNGYRSAGAFAAALHDYLAQAKGDTARFLPVSSQTGPPSGSIEFDPAPQAPMKTVSQSPEPARARPLVHPAPSPPRERSLGFGSLLFVVAVAIASLGGWYAYKAISHAVNGTSATISGAPTGHQTGQAKKGRRGGQKKVAVLAAKCPPGRVALVYYYIEKLPTVNGILVARAGQPVTFDFNLTNDSAQCHAVWLRLGATDTLSSATSLPDTTGAKFVHVPPRTNNKIYRRQFIFPSSAIGARFSITWRVTDSTGAVVYGTRYFPGGVTVTS